jgi:uncharacterized BrkB/YihY/UPF0761 family membrane protein
MRAPAHPLRAGLQTTVRSIGSRARAVLPTLRYLMEVDTHVYAFSIAANVLLGFYPFLLVLISFCRYVLHWRAAEQTIYVALMDYFPGPTGEFLARNLGAQARPVQWVSILLVLFTANGIFEPLEVALNRAWGIAKSRSFLRNQLVSMGLIFACGGLAVLSTLMTALNRDLISRIAPDAAVNMVSLVMFKLAAVPTLILVLFLIYWLLPNGPVPWRLAFWTAFYAGLAIEALKYLHLLLWPWLRVKLEHEYGVFVNSATIIVLSFAASMIVMAGAEWSARTRPAP